MKDSPLLRCLLIYGEMPLRFTLAALLYAFVNGALTLQQWLIGRAVGEVSSGAVVSRTVEGSLDFHRAWFWALLIVGLALARSIVQYLAQLLSLVIGQELLSILRERILIQVQRLDLAFHWRHGVGELVTRTTRDADKVRDALVNFWRQTFETGLVVLASVGLLCWYAPWLGIVPLLLMLTGITVLYFQTGRLVALDRAVGAAYDSVTQDLSEGVNGVRVIKAFGLEAARIDRFAVQVSRFRTEARTALAYASKRVPLPQAVIALGHVWVLGYGALLVAAGRLNIGELVAALLVANTLVLRIEGIGRVMQIFADARSSAARIWELLDAVPRILSGRARLPAGPLGLRFEQVAVAAPGGGNPVLQDVTLSIEPGEVVALVGATGSGKSTLMALLPRLADADRGAVLVGSGEAGWQDVKSLDLSRLRKFVHIVPQESFLFSDTIATNLRMAASDATDDELRDAIRLAAADDLLERLPDGLDARVGDRGLTLSGGQRQRLCLARALLARPAILGLDDATSALDAATERIVIDNIRALSRSSRGAITVLIVSSRLSTVLAADRVLLLAEGRIAAEGTHATLAAKSEAYRDLMGLE